MASNVLDILLAAEQIPGPEPIQPPYTDSLRCDGKAMGGGKPRKSKKSKKSKKTKKSRKAKKSSS
jgi:hypothetical protein